MTHPTTPSPSMYSHNKGTQMRLKPIATVVVLVSLLFLGMNVPASAQRPRPDIAVSDVLGEVAALTAELVRTDDIETFLRSLREVADRYLAGNGPRR